MLQRNIEPLIKDALQDTPVVMLIGARQAGKSTLVQSLADNEYSPQYLTLDEPTVLAAATQDPSAFLDGLRLPVILDEIQRAPQLLLPIKAAVDRNRAAGSFLLTGSANVLLLPKVADSLAGRMEVLTLRPLSQGELAGRREDFIDWVSAEKFDPQVSIEMEDRTRLFERMFTGGYPGAVSRKSEERRSAWFRSYVATLLQRDVRDLANIEGLTDLPRLISILAARSGGLLNYADISRSAGFPQTTLKRYAALFEQLFLIESLSAYSGSHGKRSMKSPKLFFGDTGLLSNIQGLTPEKIQFENSLSGLLVENFVYAELQKQGAWSKTTVRLLHFRTSTDQEVDFILELPDGSVIGIEVKSGASVDADAFKGLKVLELGLSAKFRRGIVLYAGKHLTAFGKNMFAVPIQALWSQNLA